MAKMYFDADSLFEDTDFCSDFCHGCEAMVHYLQTLEEPESWECRRSGDPRCDDCLRHSAYLRIARIVEELNSKIQDEVDAPTPGYFEPEYYEAWAGRSLDMEGRFKWER